MPGVFLGIFYRCVNANAECVLCHARHRGRDQLIRSIHHGADVLSRRTETLKAALKAVSDAAAQLKDAGFDDLAADLRASMSRIRREMNHIEAVKDHPDLFG